MYVKVLGICYLRGIVIFILWLVLLSIFCISKKIGYDYYSIGSILVLFEIDLWFSNSIFVIFRKFFFLGVGLLLWKEKFIIIICLYNVLFILNGFNKYLLYGVLKLILNIK